MNAKKCDRCGRYFECDDNYLEIRVKLIIDKTSPMFGEEYDLCESCQENFDNFMNPTLPYEKEGEV